MSRAVLGDWDLAVFLLSNPDLGLWSPEHRKASILIYSCAEKDCEAVTELYSVTVLSVFSSVLSVAIWQH